METRNKYVTAMDIYMRIVSAYKSKSQEVSPIEVIRWCSEVITDYLKDPAGLVAHKGVCIVNGKDKSYVDGRAILPNDIFKLEAIYDANRSLLTDYLYQGDYIIVSDTNKPTELYIDYYTLALDDDTGYPLIKRGYEPACYAYCVYKMFEEDASVIPPKIQQWRWMQIVQDKEYEIEAAHRSWDGVTDNELVEIHKYIVSREYRAFIGG